MTSSLMLCLCVTLLGGAVATVRGQGNTAVVTGADRVFIRRGPGTEFPPFATLTDGSAVEVQEMQGEWSRVRTASGQVGYVHSNFLALPSEAGAQAPTEVPRLTPTRAATPPRPTVHSDTAALNALTEKNKALEAQVGALQEELTALKSRAAQPPEPAPTVAADTEALHAELKRLTAAVEALQLRVAGAAPSSEAPPAGTGPTEGPERSVSSTAALLGGLGLFIGWLLGSAYGRNQERGRRSRIRF